MKKNRMMRLASGLLVAVLLTTCVISGTFAKYVSEASASDVARVAKWAFTLENVAIANDFEFDLFDYTDGNVDVNGLDDDAKVIAPGTQGSFAIDLVNNSEVNAKYSLTLAVVKDARIPLEFSVDGGNTWSADISTVKITNEAIDMTETKTMTVQWRWPFGDSANNATDTALGVEGTATAKVTATVLVEQVD